MEHNHKTEERRLNGGRKNGALKSSKSDQRPIGRTELKRLKARYRARRIRDVMEARRLGISEDFLTTVGAQYIARESN